MKQTTKDERLVILPRPKISCKPRKKFVKCSHLNLPPFFCPQDCSALFVSPASTFIIFRPIKLLLWFAYLRAKIDRKTTTSKSMQIHKRKGHLKLLCSLTRQGKIVNVIQHTRSCLSIYWAAICFCFHQSPSAGPSRCGAQCKTWARGPMQDLGVGPLWAVILWRHRVHSTVLRSWQSQNRHQKVFNRRAL